MPEIPAAQCAAEGEPCDGPGTVCRFGTCVLTDAAVADAGPEGGPEADLGEPTDRGAADAEADTAVPDAQVDVDAAPQDAGCTPQPERCNAADDDCDGVVDETVPPAGDCNPGIGACQVAGQVVCEGGVMQCDVIPGDPAAAEACDDRGAGVDDDCDTVVDEGCECEPGLTEACGTDVGACTAGTRSCDGGVWGACSGQAPQAEACNGADDDCDNLVDEGFGLGGACEVGQGACFASGQQVCNALGMRVCSAQRGEPADETCDGVDEDCDGRVDEGTAGGACDTGEAGRCGPGELRCTAGAIACVARQQAAEFEQCEGTDEDCDGRVDEGIEPRACALDRPGPCAQGTQACVNGAREACRAAYEPQPDTTCDGVDDDCDEAVDEGFVAQACVVDPAAECAQGGVQSCENSAVVCTPDPDASAELCNGVDDDCDGEEDEFIDGEPLGDAACGGPPGNRAQWARCVDGACTQACEPGWIDEDAAQPGCERGYTARQLNGGINLASTAEFDAGQGPVPGPGDATDLGVATGGTDLRLQVAGSTYVLRGFTRGVTYQRVRVYSDDTFWLVSAVVQRQDGAGMAALSGVVGVVHMPRDGDPVTAGTLALSDLGGVSGIALARDAQGWLAVANGRQRAQDGVLGAHVFARYRLSDAVLAEAAANAADQAALVAGGVALQGHGGFPEDGPVELAVVGARVVLMAPHRRMDNRNPETVFVDVLADSRLYGFGALVTSSPRLVDRGVGAADFALVSAGALHWGLMRDTGQAYDLTISRSRVGGNGEAYVRVEPQRVGGNPSLLASVTSSVGAGACQLIHLRDNNVSQLPGGPRPLFAPTCRAVVPMNAVAAPAGAPLMRLVVRDDDGYVVFGGELR